MGHPSPKYTAESKQRAVELYRERPSHVHSERWDMQARA